MRKSLFFIALLSFFLLVFYYSKITSSIIFPVKPIPDDGGEVSCSSLASTQCLARSDCCWSPHWGVCFSVGEKCCHSIASGSGSFEANNCPNDALDCYVCQSGGSWADTCSGKYPECTGKTIGESCGTNKNCDSSCNCVSVTPTQTCVMTMETIPGQDWSDYAGVRLSCSLPNSVCQQGDTLAGTFGVNQMPCPTNPIIQLSITGSGCSVKDSLAVTGYIASGPGYWGGYSWTFPTIPTGCLGKTVTLTLSSEGKSTSTTIKFSTDPTRDNQPTVPGAGSWSPSTIFSNSLITYSTHAEDDKGLSKIQILFATYPPSHAPETERLSDFSVVKTCSVSGTSADCTYTTPTSYPVGYEVCMIGIATDIQGQSNPGWDMGSRIDRNCITVCNFPSDTDNGKNYDVRGTCTNACGGSYTDFCPWSAPQGYCCSALGDYWTATSIADDGTTVCCETSGHPSPVAGSPANPCLETRTINCKNILGEYYINPSTQSCDLSFYDCSSEGKVCSNGACIPTTGDVTAPTTTAVIGSGSGGYGIALDCTDNIGGTGCKKTYYCIDNNNACSPTTQYSSQISTSCSGCCYIKYYSTDNSNNIESTKSNSFGTSCTQGGVTLTCGECKVGSTCQCSMSGTCDSGALVVTSNKDLAIAAPIVQYVPPSSITYTPLKTGEINAIAICVEPTVDIKIVQVEVSGNQGSSGLLNCPASCNKNSPCSCSVNNCNSGIFIASGDPLTSAVVKDITNPFTVSFTPTNPGTINVIAGCYDQPTRTEKASITVTDTGYACIRSNPSVTITPSSATGSVGTLQVYSINVANNDNSNCGSSTFSLSVSQCPTGWTCTLSKNSLIISAGSTDSTSISVSPNPTASSGTYTFKVTATNSGANSYSAEGSANYVIQSQQNPTPTANLWVSPVNSNGGVGSTFTIDVNIKNVKDLMGYDIKLGWDPNVLSCVSSVSHSPWPSPNYFYAHDSCYTGYYWGVGTALAPIKTFSGDTSLVTLTFKVLSAGTSSFDFKNVEIANSSFQDMSYTTTSGYFNSGNPG